MEFLRSFQSEAPLKRGAVSAQDASLQDRVLAQVKSHVLKVLEMGCFMSLTYPLIICFNGNFILSL